MKYLLIILLILGAMLPKMSEANEKEVDPANLRAMVFKLVPDEIGLSKDNFKFPVWGMVMETGYAEGSFTLVSLADGTTSLYFSNGGGIIGAGEHRSVLDASGDYLSVAQQYYKRAEKISEYPPPEAGEVKFYFLTFDGTLMYSAPEEKLGNEKDDLADLFFAAHGVITKLREIDEK